ncbi:MAG TPA: hypothetical protein VFI22_11355, partial [Thermomicrobiales bacterium]|nr:hypothetical protein [Thermomicrobiales bacterium]
MSAGATTGGPICLFGRATLYDSTNDRRTVAGTAGGGTMRIIMGSETLSSDGEKVGDVDGIV